MTWVNPQALWWLLLLPMLAGLLLLRARQPRATLPFTDLSWLPAETTWRQQFARWLPPILLLLAGLCLLLALARPRWPVEASRLPVPARVVVFVLDVSGSMAEPDRGPADKPMSRIDAAKAFIEKLVASLPGEMLGLVTFASKVETVCPPTLSRATLLGIVTAAEPVGGVTENTTNIGDALAVALDRARAAPVVERSIVLISDGEHNVEKDAIGPVLKPRQAAQLARALGIRMHTLFLEGRTVPADQPDRREQAAKLLADVATLAGGLAVRSEDSAGLAELLRTLTEQQPGTVASFQYEQHQELYPGLLLAGLGLLVVNWLMSETWLRQLPEAEGP